MKLNSTQKQQIIETIENGDTVLIIVGVKGTGDSRKQAIIMQGDGNMLARDMKRAIESNEALKLIIGAAIGEVIPEKELKRTFYRVIGKYGTKYEITTEGALVIWQAYEAMFGKKVQTMERREERGGIAHESEIEEFKAKGFLPADFDWTKYKIAPDAVEPVKPEPPAEKVYHIIDSENKGQKITINEEGAKLIWEARVKSVPEKLNFDRQLDDEENECGSILSTMGLERMKKHGLIAADFDLNKYVVAE